MAKRVKAQTINQIAAKEVADKNDKILVSSTDGIVNSIELNKLTSLFGASGSESGGSGSGSGSGSGGTIDVDLNTFNSSTFYAREYGPFSNFSYNDTKSRAYSNDMITLDEDASLYASVFIQTADLAEGRFGIEFMDASGKWFPIKSSFSHANSAGRFEGSIGIAVKAYAGCKFRAFVENGTTGMASSPITNLILYGTAIKGAAWATNSRTLTLTIKNTAPTIENNLLYVSDEVTFDSVDGSSAKFPANYDGALVTVNGYFSLNGSNQAAVDGTYQNVYLQYFKPSAEKWANFASVQVPSTKTSCNFGTFFIERGTKLRLASTCIPTTASINSPYQGCTAIIQYTAVNREEDLANKKDEENSSLCVLTDVVASIASKPNKVTVFDFEIPKLSANGQTQMTTLRFNNMKFSGSPAAISWDENVVQQIDTDGTFWHQYGYGTNVGYDVVHDTAKTYSISATSLTSLGVSTAGAATAKLPVSYGSIQKKYTTSGLKSIRIGETVQNIDNYCFTDLSNLTSITIPATCLQIGCEYTFAVATNSPTKLTKVDFAGDDLQVVAGILEHTFENLSSLTSLNVQNLKGVTRIGNNVFSNTALSAVELPNGVTDLNWNSFSPLKSLKEIVIPYSVSAITNVYSRFSGTYDHLCAVGIKLSGDDTDYPKESMTTRDKIENEMKISLKCLSSVYDIRNPYTIAEEISAVALSRDGTILVFDDKVYTMNCSQPWMAGNLQPKDNFDFPE